MFASQEEGKSMVFKVELTKPNIEAEQKCLIFILYENWWKLSNI